MARVTGVSRTKAVRWTLWGIYRNPDQSRRYSSIRSMVYQLLSKWTIE